MEWRPGTAALPGLRSHDVFGITHNFGMHGGGRAGSFDTCRPKTRVHKVTAWRVANLSGRHEPTRGAT
jgi:hypothetical protein